MVCSLVSKAASSLTESLRYSYDFDPNELLNTLGLEGARNASGADLDQSVLGEGTWDPATGGAVAVSSKFILDSHTRMRRLVTKYLVINPTGDCIENKLVEFDVRPYGEKLRIHNVHFLGRPVDGKSGDSLVRILGFLQHIHSDIRNLEMPDVGKLLYDFQITGLLGERMHLPGLGRQGGFDFVGIVDMKQAANDKTFNIPSDYLPELLGLGSNDLDPHLRFGTERERLGVDRQNGESFRCVVSVDLKVNETVLKGEIIPLNPAYSRAIPDLLHVHWHEIGKDAVIDKFVLLGEEGCDLPPVQRQKRLGVLNAMNRDLRRRKYPSLLNHIAAFDQQNLLDRHEITDGVDEHPKMVVKVYGGHNARQYLPGFGGTIGGNCKAVLTHYQDEDRKTRTQGFRVDAGITFSKQGGIQAGEHGSWDRVLPDLGADLDNVKHDLITHLHADHMQAPVDEARCGLQVGRTIHAAAYDIRVLQQFLKKEKIAPELWPTLHVLEGDGWLHLDDGKNRIQSVFYYTNAIPHSTPVTAYIIVPPPYTCDKNGRAHDITEINVNPHYWSYATLGDMSFGVYNLPGYVGDTPPDTGFKRDLFEKFKKGFRQEYPDLPQEMNKRVNCINIAECEPTSVHREGFSPDVVTFERNLVRAVGWFQELGVILSSLSTAKREHESIFRVATKVGRNLSGEGAFLENRLADMNVMGVNTDVIACNPDGGNINAYLEWYAAKTECCPVKYYRRTAQEWRELVRESPEKVFILATGSQGTEIEQDSVGTQISEGWSRFQLDPKYCRTAYGVDLRRFLIIYAQSAIPGNEDKQLDQVRKTAYENDLMIVVSVHDGARFYNIKEPFLSRIKSDCDRIGQRYTIEPMGGIFLNGFSLYPPGHGWKEDWRQGFLPWFKKNGVKMISVQHYPRLESVHIMHGLAEEIGLKHPSEPLPNHIAWTIEAGRNFKVVGNFTPSFILARDNRRTGKYYGGTTEYLRAVFPSSEGALNQSGLFATENSIYFSKFGGCDYEQALYEANLAPTRSRRDPDTGMVEVTPSLGVSRYRPTRGIASPFPTYHHPHLKRA